MQHQDVVIVGAGLAGLTTAWHLAQERRVLVLDQGNAPGQESSALGVGMVRRLVDDPVERALAHRTVRWLDDPGPDFEALLPQRTGALIGVVGEPTSLYDAAAHLASRGVRIEAIDPSGMSAFPLLKGSPVRHAWYLPDEWLLDPRQLVACLVQGLARRGVPLWTGARVEGLLVEGGRVAGVRTERGELRCESVVLAAGAWCAALAASLGLHRPLFPLRRTVLTLPEAPGPAASWVWIDDVGLYARPAAGQWWVSPCDEAVSFPRRGPGSRREAQDEHIALATRKLAEFLPALSGITPTGGWSGLRTFAPDRRPVLGPDRALPGLWWAAGLGGYGASGGWAAGEAVATWLTGGSTPWLRPELVAPDRPHLRRWPIRPDGEAAHAVLIDGRLPEDLPG